MLVLVNVWVGCGRIYAKLRVRVGWFVRSRGCSLRRFVSLLGPGALSLLGRRVFVNSCPCEATQKGVPRLGDP